MYFLFFSIVQFTLFFLYIYIYHVLYLYIVRASCRERVTKKVKIEYCVV
jgi:hypothetical protein